MLNKFLTACAAIAFGVAGGAACQAANLGFHMIFAQDQGTEQPQAKSTAVRLGSTTCEVLYNKPTNQVGLICAVPEDLNQAIPQDD